MAWAVMPSPRRAIICGSGTAGRRPRQQITAPPLSKERQSSLNYLVGVLRGEIKPDGDLSALDTNMVVMQILDAARQSVQTGKTVELKPLPQ